MVFEGIDYQRRSRKDDIKAFELLFKKYYAGLVNYSNRFLNDFDAAEEVVQDFFYNYWKNRKEIVIRVSLKAYLYRSVRNNSLKYLENLAVRRKYAEKIIAGTKDHPGYENEELEIAELNAVIDNAIDELPDRCRQIFKMSRYDGLKYQDIAAELSVSVKTVEANIGKALRHLRERLKKYNRSAIVY